MGLAFTNADLAYWGGVVVGSTGAFSLVGALGVSELPQALLGLVGGVGVGWLTEKTVRERSNRPPPTE